MLPVGTAGKVAHAWAPGLPPQPADFLQRHDWKPDSPPPQEAAPQQQETPLPAEVRTALATAEVEQRRAALSGPSPAAAGRPTPESTLIGVPPGAGQHALRAPGWTHRAAAGPCPHRRTAREHAIRGSRRCLGVADDAPGAGDALLLYAAALGQCRRANPSSTAAICRARTPNS